MGNTRKPGTRWLNYHAGIIATLHIGDKVWVKEFKCVGNGIDESLADLVSFCDKRGATVLSLSNPATIMSDIRGRVLPKSPKVSPGAIGEGGRVARRMPAPEIWLLARVGRTDLYQPQYDEPEFAGSKLGKRSVK